MNKATIILSLTFLALPACERKLPRQRTHPAVDDPPAASSDTTADAAPEPPYRSAITSNTETKKWYEGGTLHQKSGLDWQKASRADKLATCADFLTKTRLDKKLKAQVVRQIASVDDLRPYANQLVDFLDAAFMPDVDPDRNRELFENQTIAGTAAIAMVTLEWTQ